MQTLQILVTNIGRTLVTKKDTNADRTLETNIGRTLVTKEDTFHCFVGYIVNEYQYNKKEGKKLKYFGIFSNSREE